MEMGCGVDYIAEDIDMRFCFGKEPFWTAIRTSVKLTLVEL